VTNGNVQAPDTAPVTKSGKAIMDRCLWVDIVDFSRGRLYYRNYNDMNWRYVEVAKALSSNKAVASLPLYTKGEYVDDTAKAQVYNNPMPAFYSFQNP
jgi:hypothetical protein